MCNCQTEAQEGRRSPGCLSKSEKLLSQWTQGRQQGYGQRVFASGTACLGSFGRAGNLNGGGACFYPSGDSYQGEVSITI